MHVSVNLKDFCLVLSQLALTLTSTVSNNALTGMDTWCAKLFAFGQTVLFCALRFDQEQEGNSLGGFGGSGCDFGGHLRLNMPSLPMNIAGGST